MRELSWVPQYLQLKVFSGAIAAVVAVHILTAGSCGRRPQAAVVAVHTLAAGIGTTCPPMRPRTIAHIFHACLCHSLITLRTTPPEEENVTQNSGEGSRVGQLTFLAVLNECSLGLSRHFTVLYSVLNLPLLLAFSLYVHPWSLPVDSCLLIGFPQSSLVALDCRDV